MYSRHWNRPPFSSGVGSPAFVAEHGRWNGEQTAAAAEIEASLDEFDLVRVVFCDPHGLARSKTLTAAAFRTVMRDGMDFSPGPFLFDTGHAVAVDFLGDAGIGLAEIAGAGDFVVVPDPLTFQPLPHDGPRTAWILGDEFLRDGCRHPLSARNVLRQVCAQYAERGLAPVVGLEVEWYLTRRLPGPPGHRGNGFGLQGAAPQVEPLDSGYQFNLDSAYDEVAPVTDPLALRLLELGLPLRSMEHESGPGQVETTFDPLSAFDAADAMLLFRTLVKQICRRAGHHASFMSVPRFDGADPSGWHLHQSVVRAGTGYNVFAAESGAGRAVSAAGRAYLDGLLARAADLCLLSVPTVNGYRRLDPAYSLSPTRVGWDFEDRSVMVRVLGAGGSTHFENRVGEPTANPYLAIAAQLWAGLDGMTGGGRTAGGAASGWQTATPPERLPASLAESLCAFRDGPAGELLGKPLAACLTKLKESELTRFQAWQAGRRTPEGETTEWEQREYFETY